MHAVDDGRLRICLADAELRDAHRRVAIFFAFDMKDDLKAVLRVANALRAIDERAHAEPSALVEFVVVVFRDGFDRSGRAVDVRRVCRANEFDAENTVRIRWPRGKGARSRTAAVSAASGSKTICGEPGRVA